MADTLHSDQGVLATSLTDILAAVTLVELKQQLDYVV